MAPGQILTDPKSNGLSWATEMNFSVTKVHIREFAVLYCVLLKYHLIIGNSPKQLRKCLVEGKQGPFAYTIAGYGAARRAVEVHCARTTARLRQLTRGQQKPVSNQTVPGWEYPRYSSWSRITPICLTGSGQTANPYVSPNQASDYPNFLPLLFLAEKYITLYGIAF